MPKALKSSQRMPLVVAGAAIALLAGASPALAWNYSGPAGGGGGGQFGDDTCQNGFLTGVHGNHGKYVDSIGIHCAANGSFGPLHGQSGGVYAVSTCPTGFAVKGMTGTSGKYVDSLRLTCVRANDLMSSQVMAPLTFGQGGGGPYAIRCPVGEAAVGIRGRSGKYVDQIELVCWNQPQ